MPGPIPVNQPLLDGNEKRYLAECIDTGWISSEGPFVAEFERQFAARVGRRHAIAVSNGTAAIDAAVEALGIGPGDEVIMPTFTIISCVLQVVRSGATPVLVDADPWTWNVDVASIERCITPRTRAILVAHIYGLPVDMPAVLELAQRHGLAVIEDAAEAIGQTCDGRPCGSFGQLSTFSFYPNKHVTTGEGGMILTDDDQLAATCRELRNLCFQPGKRFVHERLGWNLRMTNLQAAVGLAQLERLDEFMVRKRHIGTLYQRHFSSLTGASLPLAATRHADNCYWVYGLVLDDDLAIDAAAMMQRLQSHGIGTRPFFWPLHEQPVLRERGLFAGQRFPVAERLGRRGFYLPSGLGLSNAEVDHVASVVATELKLALSR